MVLSSIKEDEEMIQLLEEIDENFSGIKSALRELRIKMGRVHEKSKEISDDCKPWIVFFEMQQKQEFSPLSDLHLNSLNYRDTTQSPDNLNLSSPKNPFVEAASSDLLNKSLSKDLRLNLTALSSTSYVNTCMGLGNQTKARLDESEDTDYEIVPFDKLSLPDLFQNEDDLINLYEFIRENQIVSLERIANHFKNVASEKLEIFISFLCRKRFVKQRHSNISIGR